MINIIIFGLWYALLVLPLYVAKTVELPFKRMETLTISPIRRGGLPRAVGGTKSQN